MQRRRHEKFCAGTIAAAMYNAAPFRKEGADLLTAADIFPELKPPEPSDEEKYELAISFFERLDALSKAEQQAVLKKA